MDYGKSMVLWKNYGYMEKARYYGNNYGAIPKTFYYGEKNDKIPKQLKILHKFIALEL